MSSQSALVVVISLLTPVPAAAQPISMPIRGISYLSYSPGAFADNTQAPTLDFIASTGANWICITTAHIIEPATNEIRDDPNQTDFDGLPTAIANARQRGLRVLLRITTWVKDANGVNLSSYSMPPPSDPVRFFAQYRALALRYATLARNQGVDMISLGNESTPIAGPQYRQYWLDIIAAVRVVFPGQLTYGALPNLALPATMANLAVGVSFWDQLDYLSFSIYPRLSTSPNPTREELEEGWRRNWYTRIDNIGVLQQYSAMTGKQILFTEIGFESARGAAADPGSPNRLSSVPDNRLQALLYDVMFAAFNSRNGNWLAGMFLWEVPASNVINRPWIRPWLESGYTFRDKPAADIVSLWFSEPQTAVQRVADRVFDWVEVNYASLLGQMGIRSGQSGPYYYRYYDRTNPYLAVAGNRFLVYQPSAGGVRDQGTLTSWFVNAIP